MKHNAFFIIFKGLLLKQIKQFFFLEGESTILSKIMNNYFIENNSYKHHLLKQQWFLSKMMLKLTDDKPIKLYVPNMMNFVRTRYTIITFILFQTL